MALFRFLSSACLVAALAPASALAVDYPVKPVKILVPLTPGGMPDMVARSLAEHLSKMWNQPVVVENRAGAGGNIGAEAAVRAEPDGHTLLLLPNHVAEINPSIYKKMSFDPAKDLQSISLIGTTPFALMTGPTVQVDSVQGLIDFVKSKPKGVTYASSGLGSNQHLYAEQFRGLTNLQMTHVPYKGGAPALVDLMGGVVDMAFTGINQALPQLASGKLKVLAVTGTKRSPQLPDVPTMGELGYSGFEYDTWVALSAPKGVPADIVEKISRDVSEVVKREAFAAPLREQSLDVRASTPAELDERIRAGRAAAEKIIQRAQISLD
ncbi:MAG: tripartite tricarboxylate transporter substrate binding protein [Pigmentiphaga sp.]|nr:tripartite tricarboxylate transporter substrate binding protein [Pigmentiphaga sp.]